MKVVVNKDLCEGHGMCAAVAPNLFEINDDGYPDLAYGGEIPAGRVENARQAIAVCPVTALRELDV